MNDTAKVSGDVEVPEISTSADMGQELKPGAAEALADIFRDLISHLSTSQQSSEKAHTSYLAYMDRIIILSGGTLTLTFTAVTTLSAHLTAARHIAKHVYFIVAACWLLIATIILGLRYIKVTIKLRHQEDLQSTLTAAHSHMKLRFLMMPAVNSIAALKAVDAIPPLLDPKLLEEKIKYLRRVAIICGSLTEIALVSAFIFLTLFIQANIVDMLSQ